MRQLLWEIVEKKLKNICISAKIFVPLQRSVE